MHSLALSIAFLLVIATLVIEYRYMKNRSPERLNNRSRIGTWWAIFVICIPIFYVGGWAITLFVYLLIFWAALEFFRLLNMSINPIKLIVFILALISYHFLILAFPQLLLLFLIIPFFALFLSLLLSIKFDQFILTRATLVLTLCISSIFSIELIRQHSNNQGYDAGLLILLLLFITAANDIFQYISGKTFGKIPLAPIISQHKTREGALGGILLTSVLCALVIPLYLNVTLYTAAFIGAILAILGILGDLYISALKRQINIKDSGTTLPGHGGLLDRIDSLILTAPGFGLCLKVIL